MIHSVLILYKIPDSHYHWPKSAWWSKPIHVSIKTPASWFTFVKVTNNEAVPARHHCIWKVFDGCSYQEYNLHGAKLEHCLSLFGLSSRTACFELERELETAGGRAAEFIRKLQYTYQRYLLCLRIESQWIPYRNPSTCMTMLPAMRSATRLLSFLKLAYDGRMFNEMSVSLSFAVRYAQRKELPS